MKLIGLILKQHREIFERQVLHFSNEYSLFYNFESDELVIDENKNYIAGFYGDNIYNITAIVGRNGVGKTQLLEILGQKFKERETLSQTSSYMIVYQNDVDFIIEVWNMVPKSIEFFNTKLDIERIDEKLLNILIHKENKQIRYNEDLVGYIQYFNRDYEYFFDKEDNETETSFFKRSIESYEKRYQNYYDSFFYLRDRKMLEGMKNLKFSISTPTSEVIDYKLKRIWSLKYINDVQNSSINLFCMTLAQTLSGLSIENEETLKILKDSVQNFSDCQIDEILSVINYISVLEKYNMKISNNSDDNNPQDENITVLQKELEVYFNHSLRVYLAKKQFKEYYNVIDYTEETSYIKKYFSRLLNNFYLDCRLEFPERFSIYDDERLAAYLKEIKIQIEHLWKLILEIENDEDNIDIGQLNHIKVPGNISSTSISPYNISDYVDFCMILFARLFNIRSSIELENDDIVLMVSEKNTNFETFLRYYDGQNSTINFPERRNISIAYEGNYYYQMKPIVSVGQDKLISLFSLIKEGSIFLIDEIEESFHLEWSRKLIREICCYVGNQAQIIFNTHSPFMLSDLKSGDVITMEYTEGDVSRKIEQAMSTFAKNIQEIMAQDMFVSNIYGDFAIYKINRLIESLKDNELQCDESDKIRHQILMVSEPILRNKLLEMYNQKFNTNVTVIQRLEKMDLTMEQRNEILNIIRDSAKYRE